MPLPAWRGQGKICCTLCVDCRRAGITEGSHDFSSATCLRAPAAADQSQCTLVLSTNLLLEIEILAFFPFSSPFLPLFLRKRGLRIAKQMRALPSSAGDESKGKRTGILLNNQE